MFKLILNITLCTFLNYSYGNFKHIIHGELSGLKDNTWLYLIHNNDNNQPDTIQKVQSKNSNFIFDTAILVLGDAYFIKIDTSRTSYPYIISGYIVLLIDDTPNIFIKGVVTDLSLNAVSVKGSKMHSEYVEFRLQSDYHVRILNEKFNKKSSSDSIQAKNDFESYKQIFKKWKMQWIFEHPDSYYSPKVILTEELNLTERQEAFNKLSERVKKAKYGVLLKKQIDIEKRTQIGSFVPDFNFPSIEGGHVSLNKIINKGKITLLDFWASWCGPCRQTFPLLRDLYCKYISLGFIVVGYSVDTQAEPWKTAVTSDTLPWINIRETIPFYAEQTYGVNELPSNLLINKDGKIIAKNLDITDLEEKLRELLLPIK